MADEAPEITAARIQAAAILAAAIIERGEIFGDGSRPAQVRGAVTLHKTILAALAE